MKKKGLLVVISLLAVACMMAAMAFNSAAVTNKASIAIKNTSTSLLALNPVNGVGNKNGTCTLGADGQMKFDFTNGRSGFDGLQPNSVYTWNNLFNITNGTNEKLIVTVEVSEALKPYVTLQGANDGNVSWRDDNGIVCSGNPQYGTGWATKISNPYVYSSGNFGISVKVTVPDGTQLTAADLEGSIIVSAVAYE